MDSGYWILTFHRFTVPDPNLSRTHGVESEPFMVLDPKFLQTHSESSQSLTASWHWPITSHGFTVLYTNVSRCHWLSDDENIAMSNYKMYFDAIS